MELSSNALANRIVVVLIIALSATILALLSLDLYSSGWKNTKRTFVGFVSDVKRMSKDVMDVNGWVRPKDNSKVPVIASTVYPSIITTASSTPVARQTVATQSPPPPPAPKVAIEPASRPQKTIPAPPDLYAWGNCTWWVAKRRAQINEPIPNSWGNADTWAERALADGYPVDHHPSPGAIMQIPWVDDGLGHVAFVESVNPDGSWRISEMNVVGVGRVDYRLEPASAATTYNFIHS